MRKIALKKLKASDLSFFKSYFSKNPLSKQKAFNLDSQILEGHFFPGLRSLLAPLAKQSAHVDLTVFGPDAKPAYSLARKIKIDAKNIRLNGELIHDPEDDSGRFDCLNEGDFVVLEFDGFPLPNTVSAVLVSASASMDQSLHCEFSRFLPEASSSMCILSDAELQDVIIRSQLSDIHPFRDWLDAELFEGIASGEIEALRAVNNRRGGRGLTIQDLKSAKATAERIGEMGEELLNFHLSSGAVTGVSTYEWTSQKNAISPYDFLLTDASSGIRHVDAKSTSGGFNSPIYMSSAEIFHAIHSDVPYDIYRLYEVRETSAKLRVAKNVSPYLKEIYRISETFPCGVRPTSFSISPSMMEFEGIPVSIDLN